MRNTLCQALISHFENERFVFLTGDLGFMALESLKESMGEFFINAGLAEQNMVSVAAGLSSQGLQTWVYSIAPFIYARPFEQIRNDICLHGFPVKLIGNGGGYGYGAMGATHHAIEDYGTLLTLKGMRVFVPAFAEDILAIVPRMAALRYPAYLRLGKCEKPKGCTLPEYAPWRRLNDASGPVILVAGPLAGGLLEDTLSMDTDNWPEFWVLTELPLELNPVPDEFINSLKRSQHLLVVEEHVAQGGLAQMMALWLLENGVELKSFNHLCARRYPSGYYGSQKFHRNECGLTADNIMRFKNMCEHSRPF